jgi:hypothetical protein
MEERELAGPTPTGVVADASSERAEAAFRFTALIAATDHWVDVLAREPMEVAP